MHWTYDMFIINRRRGIGLDSQIIRCLVSLSRFLLCLLSFLSVFHFRLAFYLPSYDFRRVLPLGTHSSFPALIFSDKKLGDSHSQSSDQMCWLSSCFFFTGFFFHWIAPRWTFHEVSKMKFSHSIPRYFGVFPFVTIYHAVLLELMSRPDRDDFRDQKQA